VDGVASADPPALRINGTSSVELLPFGERLLRNEADWLSAKPAGRWVGGVRIDAGQKLNWRFDEDRADVYRS